MRCAWFDTEKDLVCGVNAKHRVKMKDRVCTVEVELCDKHSAEHNTRASQLRLSRRARPATV